MFSFFKSGKEKALEKLGYKTLIDSYKQKVTNKEWDNKKYKEAIDKLFNDQKAIVSNANNVNVATRQSFVDDEVMVPLNLQNIQQEYIDYDFIFSTLVYEFKNHKKIHTQAVHELMKYLESKYSAQQLFFENSLKDVTTENLILKVTTEDFSEKFSEIYACLSELKRRL